jgi:hypothetical protein
MGQIVAQSIGVVNKKAPGKGGKTRGRRHSSLTLLLNRLVKNKKGGLDLPQAGQEAYCSHWKNNRRKENVTKMNRIFYEKLGFLPLTASQWDMKKSGRP